MRDDPQPKKKLCNGCDTWKELVHFHVNNSKKDGHESQCKVCRTKGKKSINAKPQVEAVQTPPPVDNPIPDIILGDIPRMSEKEFTEIIEEHMKTSIDKQNDKQIDKQTEETKVYTLTIDFSDHTYLYEILIKESFLRFRTPEKQVMAILDRVFDYADYMPEVTE